MKSFFYCLDRNNSGKFPRNNAEMCFRNIHIFAHLNLDFCKCFKNICSLTLTTEIYFNLFKMQGQKKRINQLTVFQNKLHKLL